ncbi:SGNH/GDSL hydrolase family protein [Virgisporangium aurantiacum]|uniref:Lipase n=1 Tax=Virgisporangium aurantiacum TaxID=175570 RepID=A0A8J3ZF92_9ACTN|nr:SGNH/GDSL hydrolase family protein [Virgisporangium aurantiacum]GIJ60248.1 lipase [Virgisporangium aurantiacum]
MRIRPVVAVVALVALFAGGAVTATGRASAAHPPAPVHTAGRVKPSNGGLLYSWPGVYFEGRFRGTSVGVTLDDPAADYDVEVDGAVVATLVTPAAGTHRVSGLARGTHRIRVVKRSESPWATSSFGGFVAGPGGAILAAPPARRRQIEFIGDSYTAGYGNMSATRTCTSDELHRTTNADRAFGALTARRFGADYQTNAFSGRGMVRNYNGSDPGTDYRTYYERALLAVPGDVWPTRGWRPQLVVVGLGINDFSTPVNPGEPWTAETLATAYREAYQGFIDTLRARYGPRAVIVVSATYVYNTTALADAAQQVVAERNARGDDRVRYWYYGNEGLDYGGCDWHPSRADHEVIANRLTEFVDTLQLRW